MRRRRLSLAASGALFAAMLSGCALRADVPLTPGPALHTDCRGQPSAAPTVILESGAFGAAADWDPVLADLSRGGRVCAYDRGGIGRSPARAGGEDVVSIARELDALLAQIGERRPVILVGHSNGALYAETYAALYPNRVAGLLYVNGVNSDDLDYPLLIADLTRERKMANLAGTMGSLGLAPVVASILANGMGLQGDANHRKHEALADPDKMRVARDEDRAVIPGLTAVRNLGGSPPQIPTAVIFGAVHPDEPLFRAWEAAETAPAKRAKVSWVLEAPGATHTSPLVRDRAYVVAAVTWLRSVAPAGP